MFSYQITYTIIKYVDDNIHSIMFYIILNRIYNNIYYNNYYIVNKNYYLILNNKKMNKYIKILNYNMYLKKKLFELKPSDR